MRGRSNLRHGRAVALGMAVATAMAACGGGGGGEDDMAAGEVVQVAGASRLAPAADAPVGAVVTGLNDFAAELFAAARTDENLVFSPLSVAYAFAMLRVGANGTSAAELDRAFGLPVGFAAAFNALTQALVSSGPPAPPPAPPTGEENPPPSDPTLHIANGLFTQRGFTYGENFLRTLTEQFGGELRTLDFTESDQAVDAVNGWASTNTAGRIPRIVDGLDPATVLVLLNAVHLDADWQTPFKDAGDRPFAAGRSTVDVPMMKLERLVGYTKGNGYEAVELPYFGDRLAMRVLLPTGDRAPADLLKPGVLAAAARTKPTRALITMPRWDFGTDLDLKALMSAVGVRAVFDPDAADLSGISSEQQLYVQQAKHKANITVDELGTVASAVTALGIGVTSAPAEPPLRFTVDRPFAFVIVDTKTGTPVFVGQVMDPRQPGTR